MTEAQILTLNGVTVEMFSENGKLKGCALIFQSTWRNWDFVREIIESLLNGSIFPAGLHSVSIDGNLVRCGATKEQVYELRNVLLTKKMRVGTVLCKPTSGTGVLIRTTGIVDPAEQPSQFVSQETSPIREFLRARKLRASWN